MPGIFISYRREDSAGHAGRLFDRLTQHFGKDRIFMDVSDIEPGTDFVDAIDKAVGSCEILIVVIGREWLTCAETGGQRRLDNPNDFIRLEAATALKRAIRVIPVLVQGARMPKSEEIPADLERLARRQGIEISDTRWDSDTGQLIKVLEAALASDTVAKPVPKAEERFPIERSKRKLAAIFIAIVSVFALAIGGWFFWPQKVEVPRLTSNPLEAAKSLIGERGLALGNVREEETERESPGTVLRQNPDAGLQVESGAKVDLVVAVVPRVAVPDVIKRSFVDAGALITKAGLIVGRKDLKATEETAPGTVISQKPMSGERLERGKTVDVVVAVKPKIKVPDVLRQTTARAEIELQKAGLVVGTVQEKDLPNARPGTVLSQTPQAGYEADKGTKVDLIVAAVTTAKATVSVPSLVRLDLPRAKTTLEAAGLVVGAITERAAERTRPGTVLSQSLPAGQQVEKGAKIDLVVVPPAKKPEVGEADYDAVQEIYVTLRPMVDCREVRRLMGRLTAYYSNNNLVPEDKSYTVIYPAKKSSPTIADLARDRVTRIQGAKKNCFVG
jgi:beta-lactam-binding protein with PASTA domain